MAALVELVGRYVVSFMIALTMAAIVGVIVAHVAPDSLLKELPLFTWGTAAVSINISLIFALGGFGLTFLLVEGMRSLTRFVRDVVIPRRNDRLRREVFRGTQPVADAVRYIADYTAIGQGSNSGAARNLALSALLDSARDGSIRIAGIPVGATKHVVFSKQQWKQSAIDLPSILDVHNGTGGKMVDGPTNDVVATHLVVEESEIKGKWVGSVFTHNQRTYERRI